MVECTSLEWGQSAHVSDPVCIHLQNQEVTIAREENEDLKKKLEQARNQMPTPVRSSPLLVCVELSPGMLNIVILRARVADDNS